MNRWEIELQGSRVGLAPREIRFSIDNTNAVAARLLRHCPQVHLNLGLKRVMLECFGRSVLALYFYYKNRNSSERPEAGKERETRTLYSNRHKEARETAQKKALPFTTSAAKVG